jgi:hypothetical protein
LPSGSGAAALVFGGVLSGAEPHEELRAEVAVAEAGFLVAGEARRETPELSLGDLEEGSALLAVHRPPREVREGCCADRILDGEPGGVCGCLPAHSSPASSFTTGGQPTISRWHRSHAKAPIKSVVAGRRSQNSQISSLGTRYLLLSTANTSTLHPSRRAATGMRITAELVSEARAVAS